MSSTDGVVKKVNYFDAIGIMALICTCIVIATTGSSIATVNAMVPRFMIAMDLTATHVAFAAMLVAGLGAVFAFIGTKVIELLSPKVCLIIGCILLGLYLIITGATTNYALFVAAGICGGIGMGIGTIPAAIGISNQYYGEYSGRMSGVFICAMMLGASLISMLVAWLLETYDYGVILIGIGLVAMIGGTLLCLILLRRPSEPVRIRVEELKTIKAAKKDQGAITGFTAREALKKSSFWIMAFGMFFGAVILAFFATYSAVFFTEPPINMPLTDATRWRGLMQFFNAVNVLWIGFVVRRLGVKKYIWVVYGSIFVGALLFLVWMPFQFAFILAVALFLSAFDQCTTAAPANVVPQIFGRKDYTGINAAMMGFYYAGVLFCQIVAARLIDVFGSMYSIVFIAVCSLLSLGLFLIAIRLSPIQKMIKDGLIREEDIK